MELNDDPELRTLLREWHAPDAPESLDRCVLGLQTPWWRFLLTGSIRVPVPMIAATVATLIALTAFLVLEKPPSAAEPTTVNLQDFRPVEKVNVRILRSGYAIP